jgi:hypothetical protein
LGQIGTITHPSHVRANTCVHVYGIIAFFDD